MNKIIKTICVLALLMPTFLMSSKVLAGTNDSKITYQRINNAYYYQKDSSGKVDSNHVTKFFLNGQISYCIEPMTDITTGIYNSTDSWSIVKNLSSEQKDDIELIGYFGYEYPNHQSDRYYLATQLLIWEVANKNIESKFTTGENGSGQTIDLSNEKGKILSLVKEFKDLRNDIKNNGSTFPAGTSTTFTFPYIKFFEIESKSDNIRGTINGNDLRIEVGNFANEYETLNLVSKTYDKRTSIIYYNGSSQKLASLRISNPIRFRFDVKVKWGKLNITKFGEHFEFGDGEIKYENKILPNVTYGLYANQDIYNFEDIVYHKGDLITKLTTDKDGKAYYDHLLYADYYLKELDNGESGHILDEQEHNFRPVNEQYNTFIADSNFTFTNKLPKGELEFQKIDEDTKIPLANVGIKIYNEDNILVFEGITSEDGKINLTLPLGKYYVVESKALDGYIKNDKKYFFEISENNQVVELIMENKEIPDTPTEIIKVPDTLKNSNYIIEFISIGFLAIGIGLCVFYFYKKKK